MRTKLQQQLSTLNCSGGGSTISVCSLDAPKDRRDSAVLLIDIATLVAAGSGDTAPDFDSAVFRYSAEARQQLP